MIAHNLFGFDMLFFIKGYCATACGTKDLDFGGTNLTHINYGNIAEGIIPSEKIVDINSMFLTPENDVIF